MEEEAKEVGLDRFNATIGHYGTFILKGITGPKLRLLQCTFGVLRSSTGITISWTDLLGLAFNSRDFLQNLKFQSQLNDMRSWAGIGSS